jgi:predicted nucleic acid-binding protein
VAIKWFVVEPYTAQAEDILTQYHAGDINFLAPDLIYAEVGNIAWRKQRFEGMAATDAREIVATFQSFRFTITASAVLLEDALQIAITHQQTVYDSLYVALSNRESCRFVTADEKLYKALKAYYPLIVWIGNWGLR